MSKRLKALLFLVAAALLIYDAGLLAEVQSQRFEMSVKIPEQAFYVLPANPQVLIKEQAMEWDMRMRLPGLRPVVADFDVKNTAGAVYGYLAADLASPSMSNGTEKFDLKVMFNGHVLSSKPMEVVNPSAARAGSRVQLEIRAVPPGTGKYSPGTYYGNVRIIFDAMLPSGV